MNTIHFFLFILLVCSRNTQIGSNDHSQKFLFILFPSLFAVMNNPELPLDPNLQTSNLLITFLKYSSIIMQDTKGKISLFLFSRFSKNHVSFHAACSLPRQHPNSNETGRLLISIGIELLISMEFVVSMLLS